MASQLRKVRFPLKIKLLSVLLVLITLALAVFLWIALKIFREDKSAYIFENLLNKAASEQIILSHKLGEKKVEVGEGILALDEDLKVILKNHLEKEISYQAKFIVLNQSTPLQWTEEGFKSVSEDEKNILSDIARNSIHQAVKEITLEGEKVLYAYNYNPEKNFAYVVSLTHEKAFSAMTYLIEKSRYYGMFILGISILLSVLLARPLTAQLEALFAMTQELARGNFEKRISISGHDEVGALSDSVNDMADKIVSYMEQMKEKARLENEVMVAQLVQSSFFPNSVNRDKFYEVCGHFEPASECGGDWWGIYDTDNWRITFIADATGHGVPAALLTATINCCKNSLNFILESKPQIVQQPHEILRFMNQAVCGAGNEIQVTCFVACYNRSSKELVYSNSSHTPPLLFNGSDPIEKENFIPLIDANGPRLGQNKEASFSSKHVQLKTSDTIVLYTDGLTEIENIEGQRYGERRFLKSLANHGRNDPKDIINGIVVDYKNFAEGKQKSDDITAVVAKVLS